MGNCCSTKEEPPQPPQQIEPKLFVLSETLTGHSGKISGCKIYHGSVHFGFQLYDRKPNETESAFTGDFLYYEIVL